MNSTDQLITKVIQFNKNRRLAKFFDGKTKGDIDRYNCASLRRAVRALERLSRKHVAQQIIDDYSE